MSSVGVMLLPVTQTIAARAEALSLDRAALAHFSRHILLPEVGPSGQRKLVAARVLVVGAGGLGCPVALYLAAAGVGTIGLIDFDVVEASNLQRQILFRRSDEGRAKVDAAASRLEDLSPVLQLKVHDERLDADNAAAILSGYDLVIDGTDNFATRYLVNDACVLLKKPLVHGAIFRFDGQLSVFYAPHGPCYRCLFPYPPEPGQVPNCGEGGVLGVLPGLVGVAQATEAIKLILGLGESLLGRLVNYDARTMRFREFQLRRDAGCPVCGDEPKITSLTMSASACRLPPATCRDEDPAPGGVDVISAVELDLLRRRSGALTLLDVRGPEEAALCRIEGSILIPLAGLKERLGELRRESEVIVYCKTGLRSRQAAALLRDAAFPSVKNLEGGILAWIDAVDPKLVRY